MSDDLRDRTIQDFGDQWTRYTENTGYYGSAELLVDIFGPLLSLDDLRDKRVAEIGSGTGRIVEMLLSAAPSHVTALEPSSAIDVLKANTASHSDRITYLCCRGDQLSPDPKQDVIISIGVIHHIPDPGPVLSAAFNALKPGGQILIWVYGREGNSTYLAIAKPLRAITTRLPHFLLAALCYGINCVLSAYLLVAKSVPVPMRQYLTEVFGRFSWRDRYLVIYDQLKPAYAKYYSEDEARGLLENAGFVDVELYHRHRYSWTVVGRRP